MTTTTSWVAIRRASIRTVDEIECRRSGPFVIRRGGYAASQASMLNDRCAKRDVDDLNEAGDDEASKEADVRERSGIAPKQKKQRRKKNHGKAC